MTALRVKLEGDRNKSRGLVGDAMRFMGILKNAMSFNNLKQLSRLYRFDDGISIFVQSVFGQDLIRINTPEIIVVPKEGGGLLDLLIFCVVNPLIVMSLEIKQNQDQEYILKETSCIPEYKIGSVSTKYGSADIIIYPGPSILNEDLEQSMKYSLIIQSNPDYNKHYAMIPGAKQLYAGAIWLGQWGIWPNTGWLHPQSFKVEKPYILETETNEVSGVYPSEYLYSWGRRDYKLSNDKMVSKWHKIITKTFDPEDLEKIFIAESTTEDGVKNNGVVAITKGDTAYYPIATIGSDSTDVIMISKNTSKSTEEIESEWTLKINNTIDELRSTRDPKNPKFCNYSYSFIKTVESAKDILNQFEGKKTELRFGNTLIDKFNLDTKASSEVRSSKVINSSKSESATDCGDAIFLVDKSYVENITIIDSNMSFLPWLDGIWKKDVEVVRGEAGYTYSSEIVITGYAIDAIDRNTTIGTYIEPLEGLIDYDHKDGENTFILFYKYYDENSNGGAVWDIENNVKLWPPVVLESTNKKNYIWKMAYKLNGGEIITEQIADYFNYLYNLDPWGVKDEFTYKVNRSGNRIADVSCQVTDDFIIYTYSIENLKPLIIECKGDDDYVKYEKEFGVFTYDDVEENLRTIEPEVDNTIRIVGIIDINTGKKKEYTYNEISDTSYPSNIKIETFPNGNLTGPLSYRISALSLINQTLASSPSQITLMEPSSVAIGWEKIDNAIGYCVYGRTLNAEQLLGYTQSLSWLDNGNAGPGGFPPSQSDNDKTPRLISAIAFYKNFETEEINV